MNDLGITLLWTALQITMVAGLATGIHSIISRRGTGALVPGVSLGIILILSCAAICPLPAWWTWNINKAKVVTFSETADYQLAREENHVAVSEIGTRDLRPQRESGLALTTHFLQRIRQGMEQTAAGPAFRQSGWCSWLAVIFLTGAGICLMRFLLALLAVHRLCCRSTPIENAALTQRLEKLAVQLNCCRYVAIRESDELMTAATVGWRHPTILLPADWRKWSGQDIQAVLAHELAHVCRNDYAWGLMARLCVAWHFYHPLVRRLANSLQLEQELAADALGAQYAGGRMLYLRSLAQIALRQDSKSLYWPARAFLPAHGTLMKRIIMLQTKERTPGPWTVRMSRILTGTLLFGTALAVSTWRGPSQSLAADGSVQKEEAMPVATTVILGGLRREPFDLTYAPRDAIGLIAFRPAEIFAAPGMQAGADLVNRELAQLLQESRLPDLNLKIEDIDQVMGGVFIRFDEKAPEGRHGQILSSISYIRTVKPFDWKKHLHAAFPDLCEITHAGKVFYKSSKPAVFMTTSNCYFTPDDRTIVFDTENKLRRLLEGKTDAPLPYLNKEMWCRVEKDLVALAWDNRSPEIAKTAADSKDPEVGLFLRSNCQMVFGVDGPDIFRFRGLAQCASEEDGKKLVNQIQAMVQLAKGGLVQARAVLKDAAMKKEQEAAIKISKDFLDQVKIDHQGTKVFFQSEVKADMADLIPTAYQKSN